MTQRRVPEQGSVRDCHDPGRSTLLVDGGSHPRLQRDLVRALACGRYLGGGLRAHDGGRVRDPDGPRRPGDAAWIGDLQVQGLAHTRDVMDDCARGLFEAIQRDEPLMDSTLACLDDEFHVPADGSAALDSDLDLPSVRADWKRLHGLEVDLCDDRHVITLRDAPLARADEAEPRHVRCRSRLGRGRARLRLEFEAQCARGHLPAGTVEGDDVGLGLSGGGPRVRHAQRLTHTCNGESTEEERAAQGEMTESCEGVRS